MTAILWSSGAQALAAGDADSESCPNEALTGFRAYLPDCRAYEQATPVFKAGASLQPVGISSDGSRLVSEAIAVAGGVQGDSFRSDYTSERTASGWVTFAINPPSSLFPAQLLFAVSTDQTRSLWKVRAASESVNAANLELREPDGSFVEVGPLVPRSVEQGPPAGAYQEFSTEIYPAAATTDLSRVFFEPRGSGFLWPGDTTQNKDAQRSLYEYIGTGNERPELVGIDDEGSLISDCGTSLGSISADESTYDVDVYNAVSADGETVFFTAAGHSEGSTRCEEALKAPQANEVLARIGVAPAAHTVSISEPSEAECEECQTGTATARHPAVLEGPAEFAGASEDGSKAFFLSSQELFAGDQGKNLFEYDFANPAGQRVLQVSTGVPEPKVLGVARVSEDGSHVYFVAEGILTGENSEGKTPKAEQPNMYVFERDAEHSAGRLTYVATLSGADAHDWQSEDERPVQATPSGRFLVFKSVADLTAGDTSSVAQVFEYDAAEERLVRVSVGEAGYPEGQASADAHAANIPQQTHTQTQRPAERSTFLAVSDDGADIVFSDRGALTRGALAASAANAGTTYEYRSVGSIANGAVYQVSDGENLLTAPPFGVTRSGDDIFFKTPDALVPGDGDSQFDVYDARIGGGFPFAVRAEDCLVLSSCQPAAAGPPTLGHTGGGSAGALAGGNLPVFTPPPPPAHSGQSARQRALKACRREHPRRRRVACERRVKKRFPAKRSGRSTKKGR